MIKHPVGDGAQVLGMQDRGKVGHLELLLGGLSQRIRVDSHWRHFLSTLQMVAFYHLCRMLPGNGISNGEQARSAHVLPCLVLIGQHNHVNAMAPLHVRHDCAWDRIREALRRFCKA